MDYDVKNIELEKLNIKTLSSVFVVVIIFVIASLIFVYFWFTLKTQSIIDEQYLSQDSESYAVHKQKQVDYIKNNYELSIEESKQKFLKERNK
jgi:predicted PurR-regulated permease PerM